MRSPATALDSFCDGNSSKHLLIRGTNTKCKPKILTSFRELKGFNHTSEDITPQTFFAFVMCGTPCNHCFIMPMLSDHKTPHINIFTSLWCAVCFKIILCQWGKQETILVRFLIKSVRYLGKNRVDFFWQNRLNIWAENGIDFFGKIGSIFGLKIVLFLHNIRVENRVDFWQHDRT